jgi:predicted transcriptional regulator
VTLQEIVDLLDFRVRAGAGRLTTAVGGGYASDLLSDVMAHAAPGDLWITLQTHQNIVAVAVVKELAGIVVVNGREPDEDTVAKAEEEDVPLMTSDRSTFELAGRLYRTGLAPAETS